MVDDSNKNNSPPKISSSPMVDDSNKNNSPKLSSSPMVDDSNKNNSSSLLSAMRDASNINTISNSSLLSLPSSKLNSIDIPSPIPPHQV